jgi:NAD(P)-dependent dehydrogenase (short-subunit alcohol dehydrogenase family)
MTQPDANATQNYLGLANKKILVTGASSGIGRATAIEASRHGARVALLGRRIDALQITLDQLSGTGHLVTQFDMTNLDEIPTHVQKLAIEMDGLDAVVHAAGVHSAKPLRTIDASHLDDVLRSNVSSAVMLAKGFRNKKIIKHQPSLVFLSSVTATVGKPGISAYAASKGAITALTKSLALELAPSGIRVNCVEPGIVTTQMTERIKNTVGATAFAAIESAHPLGLGTPENVAHAIIFLLSSAATWITGSSLVVDGGYTAQ